MKKKIYIHIIINAIVLILFTIYGIVVCNENLNLDLNINININIVSIASFIYLGYVTIIHKKITNKMLSPIIMFFCSLYFFNFGQLIFEALNINFDTMRMTDLFSEEVIFKSCIIAFICLIGFFEGTLISLLKKIRFGERKESKTYECVKNEKIAMIKIGYILLVIFILPIIYVYFKAIKLSIEYGYPQWVEIDKMLNVSIIFVKPIAIVILLIFIICCDQKIKKQNILFGIFFLLGFLDLLMGTRTDGIAILLTALWLRVYIYGNEKLKIKEGTFLFIILFLISFVEKIRTLDINNKMNFSIESKGMLSKIINPLAELGGSLRPLGVLVENMHLALEYKYGKTIIDAILVGVIHPSSIVKYFYPNVDQNLATFITDIVGTPYGIGFSLTGEFYWNFGWLSGVFMIGFGIIVSKYLLYLKKEEFLNNPKKLYLASMLLFIIFTLPRRSLDDVTNKIVYFIIIPIILINFMEGKHKKSN